MPQNNGKRDINVYMGEALAAYHFGEHHPFGPNRHAAFQQAFENAGLQYKTVVCDPITDISRLRLEYFHTAGYIEHVITLSKKGNAYLDGGDTPAVKGIYEAASCIAATTLEAGLRIINNQTGPAFIPIGGLHHARRNSAAGFCVFNDIGILIEVLKREYQLTCIAYIDIDAHHGDGVYYAFEYDPAVIFVDIHQDGNSLYPGTGFPEECGKGIAEGTKMNLSLAPSSGNEAFFHLWPKVESFIEQYKPQFIILQAGVDSMANDPITQLMLTQHAHGYATSRLKKMANNFCDGRLLVLGGGGYNLQNIARGWTEVVKNLL